MSAVCSVMLTEPRERRRWIVASSLGSRGKVPLPPPPVPGRGWVTRNFLDSGALLCSVIAPERLVSSSPPRCFEGLKGRMTNTLPEWHSFPVSLSDEVVASHFCGNKFWLPRPQKPVTHHRQVLNCFHFSKGNKQTMRAQRRCPPTYATVTMTMTRAQPRGFGRTRH